MPSKITGNAIPNTQTIPRGRTQTLTTPIMRNLMLKNAPSLPGLLGGSGSRRSEGGEDFGDRFGEGRSGTLTRSSGTLGQAGEDNDLEAESQDETSLDTEDKEILKPVGGFAKNLAQPEKHEGFDTDSPDETSLDTEDKENQGLVKTGKKTVAGNGEGDNIGIWTDTDYDASTDSDFDEDDSDFEDDTNFLPSVKRDQSEGVRPKPVRIEDMAIEQIVQHHSEDGNVRAGDLVKTGAMGEDRGALSREEKKPRLERAKDMLAALVSKLKTGFANCKFKVLDFISKKSPDVSPDAREAKLDRKHARLEKSHVEISLSSNDGLEFFTKVKWTGDTSKDRDMFHKISNRLTHLEKNIRGELKDKEGALKKEFGNDLKSAVRQLERERSKLLNYIGSLEAHIKDRGNDPEIQRFVEKLQVRRNELRVCDEKLDRLNLDGFHSGKRTEYASKIVAKARELYLSEVSMKDLAALADKFRQEGHPSKAEFVDRLMEQLENREITATPEKLKEMRLDRDEEIAANYKPSVDYRSSIALVQFSGTPTQVSLTVNRILRDLQSDHADPTKNPDNKTFDDFVADKMKKMVTSTRLADLNNFDIGKMANIARELYAQGQIERASLLDIIVANVEWIRTPEGQIEHYKPIAISGLAVEEGPNTFLRNSGEPLPNALVNVMNAAGIQTYRTEVNNLVAQICKDLKDDVDTNELKKLIGQNKVNNWSEGETVPDVARAVMKFSLELFQAIGMVGFPRSIHDTFTELSGEVMKRPTVEENAPKENRGNGLTIPEKNDFVRKMFVDQVLLKVINSVLTVDVQTSNIPDVKAMAGLLKLVAQFAQDVANQQNLAKPEGFVDEVDNDPNVDTPEKLANDLHRGAVRMAALQDEMLINFGMRPESTSKNILNLDVFADDDN